MNLSFPISIVPNNLSDSISLDDKVSNAHINQSTPSTWTFATATDLFGFTVGTLCNIGVLCAIISSARTQFSAFSVYLINLLLCNLYHNIPPPLILFLMKISPSVRDSPACCTILNYTQITSLAVVILSHLVVTINRIWAVTFPHVYRSRHTKKLAVSLCVVSWLYANTLPNAAVILDALYYRQPVNKMAGRCYMENRKMMEISAACTVLYMIIPMLLILAGFPAIWYVRRLSHRKVKTGGNISKQRHRLTERNGTEQQSKTTNNSIQTNAGSMTPGSNTSSDLVRVVRVKVEERIAYKLYFLITLSTIICWMPIVVAFGLASFALVPNYSVFTLFQLSYLFFYVETIVDPALMICLNRDWRRNLRRRFFKH